MTQHTNNTTDSKTIPAGTKVICDGKYEGRIVRHYAEGMYEIRMSSGMICTDEFEIIK